ncbi:MAG: type II toxin-antitoxin system VapC family toxin [Bryobacterales bacterium]|nr:type II toxin-antitoxin system VapC family toxin [Bryobacterales bacterium]MBV9400460.1 type II toxin-antitoxin system VapC family toxin [Bryobacterales bacterium]
MEEGLGGIVISYLDTQIVVWLCEGQLKKLTDSAAAAMEDYELVVSPIVLLELQYLYEIGRIVRQPLALLNQLENQLGLAVKDGALEVVIRSAMFETWTRDPFDRMIVAHAKSDSAAPLITSDEKIREHYKKAIW